MAKLRKVSEEAEAGPAVYNPNGRQCWYCLHNKVSDLCSDCLHKTELFETSGGKDGEYKPAWEYSTVDDTWAKGKD